MSTEAVGDLAGLLDGVGCSVESVLVVHTDETRTRVEFSSRRHGGRTLALLDRCGDVADARGPDGPLLLARREVEGHLLPSGLLGDLEEPVSNADYTRLAAAVGAARAHGFDSSRLPVPWDPSGRGSPAWRHLRRSLVLEEVPAPGFHRSLGVAEALGSGAPVEWVFRRYEWAS